MSCRSHYIHWLTSSAQFKMVFKRWRKPTCAPPSVPENCPQAFETVPAGFDRSSSWVVTVGQWPHLVPRRQIFNPCPFLCPPPPPSLLLSPSLSLFPHSLPTSPCEIKFWSSLSLPPPSPSLHAIDSVMSLPLHVMSQLSQKLFVFSSPCQLVERKNDNKTQQKQNTRRRRRRRRPVVKQTNNNKQTNKKHNTSNNKNTHSRHETKQTENLGQKSICLKRARQGRCGSNRKRSKRFHRQQPRKENFCRSG